MARKTRAQPEKHSGKGQARTKNRNKYRFKAATVKDKGEAEEPPGLRAMTV